jgi:proline iminopeptidase
MRPALKRHGFVLLALAWSCSGPAKEPASTGLENGSFELPLSGYGIHYEVHGRGPVLMTVPNSWGLTLEGLRALYRPLEESFTLVYFDPRGMGRSTPARAESDRGPEAVRADFEALRRHLGLTKVSAIGWSNGASNLIVLAAENPEAIENAIFVHGTASFALEELKPLEERYPDLTEAFAGFYGEMMESSESEAEQNARVKAFDTEVWFPYLYHDLEAGKKAIPEIFRDAGFSWAHAQQTNKEWATFDFRDRLAAIRARSLVIAGRHDIMPPSKVQEIADGIAGSEFIVFEDSGHFSPVEEKERFVSTVLEFLR